MKATKKIVGAACALVAAVALSAGSTFAWFSMSGTVTATGMNVKATTSKNLVIGLTNNGEFKSSAAQESPKNALTELSPASTVDANKFFYVSNPAKIDYESGEVQNDAIIAAAANSADGATPKITYYVQYEYYVKADTTTPGYTDLWVSGIEVKDSVASAAADSRISNALRVAVTYKAPDAASATTYIYAPVYIPKASESRPAYDAVKTGGTVGAASGAPTFEAVSLKTASTTMSDAGSLGKVTTTATSVTITVWYEGQDADCTSGNSISVEALSIVVSLTASGDLTA